MKLLLDASVVIDFLRRKDKFNSMYMQSLDKGFDFMMSSVTVAEVFAGGSTQSGGKQKTEWEEMLSGIEVRGVDIEMARTAGRVKHTHRLSLGDAFVVALALERNIPLATLDRKAFSSIKGLMLYPRVG